MAAPSSSPVTDHLVRQLEAEEALLGGTSTDSQAVSVDTSAAPQDTTTDPPQEWSSSLPELTGLQTMDRPWRLFPLGFGAAIGLAAWLVVANGQTTASGSGVSLALFVSALVVGLGLLAIAGERDRLGPTVKVLSGAVALAYSIVVWLNPTPFSDIDQWATSQRALSALGGLGAGTVLAGVICLAMIRRSPTLTVALTLLAGVSVLAGVTVLRTNSTAGVVVFSCTFFCVLGAWDRSPRREVAFERPPDMPRATRAALSLSVLALSGTAIDSARHADSRGSWSFPAVITAVTLILFALSALFRLRSDMEDRDTRLSDWKSWMREIRTNEFRRGLEDLGARAESGGDDTFADLGEPLRAESDPTGPVPVVTPAAAAATSTIDSAASPPVGQAPVSATPAVDQGALGLDQVGDPAMNAALEPTTQRPSPPTTLRFDGPVHTGAPRAALLPAPNSRNNSTWAAQFGAPTDPYGITIPTAPKATDTPARDQTPEPAASVEPLDTTPDKAADRAADRAPQLDKAPGLTGTGAFSAFAQPEPIPADVSSADALAAWLETADRDQPELIVAIECMYLASFNTLTPAQQSRVVAEVLAAVGALTPTPNPVAWIDGPYFLAIVPGYSRSDIVAINKQLQVFLASALELDDVTIPLQGTLALLTPRESLSFDVLLDSAVTGLLHARRLES